jgi:IS4 transposase
MKDVKPYLLEDEIYTVVDGYFAKKKFVDGVRDLDLHQVGKLRCDANMRYLYTGPKRAHGSGRQKTYDGKVNWQDLSRFEYIETQEGIDIYSLVLNHVSLKRNVKVVVLLDLRNEDKKRYAILFSTDTQLDAKRLVRYYKARFQIEFIFRDAKQFTGLCDCQARGQKRLDFHFNAALTTLNLAKLEHLQAQSDTRPTPFSMASIKACYFNTFFLQKIFSMLDIDLNLIKKSPLYQKLRDYGKIAA